VHHLKYDKTGAADINPGTTTFRLSTEAGYLFWTDYATKVKGSKLDGSSLTTIAVMASPDAIGGGWIAADPAGAMVYWTTYIPQALMRTSTDGMHQTPTTIVAHNPAMGIDSPQGVAVDATYVYWGDSDGVRRMKVAEIGMPSPTIEVFDLDATAPVTTVIIDADRVYWIAGGGDLRSKAKSAGQATMPFYNVTNSPDQLMGLTVDETYVYWVTIAGTVWKAPRAGATLTELGAGPPLQGDSAGGIAVDCGAVYWAVPAGAPPNDVGQVFRVPKGN
jgi:hypothetical protein